MVGDRGHRARGRRVDRGQGGRARDRRDQRPDLDRHLRPEEAVEEIRADWEEQGPKDQAPRRLPRLPLAPDRADARGVRRGRPEPRPTSEPKIPIVSNVTGELLDRRAGHRPRLLGAPRARAGALRRRGRDPRRAGRQPPSSSSAPTRSSARWRAECLGEERGQGAPSSPPCAGTRRGRARSSTALAARPRRRGRGSTGGPSSRHRRQARPAADLPLPAQALLARLGASGRRTLGAVGPGDRRAPAAGGGDRGSPATARASLLTGRLSLADPPLAGRPRRRRHRRCCPAPPSSSWRCGPPSRSAPRRSRS